MGRTLRSPGHLALMAALKNARLAANLTQTELAHRLDRPQSFVAKYEKGERKIEVVEFVHVVRAIGCNAVDVLEAVQHAEFAA
ncbi:helix-turn-helix transcriptional regulator [Thalassobius sp. I31.1]|uniref:helix-turn-helix domain-containing protein n=1 Tax=Thalassobius sp. I31.1 TaxID=2109912 RepID=UPI000D1AFAC0|nr:helix-turn-helix transcriptional regulator [Thalassobius sp. I31.1]